ncbi:InlB B-repeat-containing protein [Allobaculum mucilyticum]|uniref:InlB B-repeat-containing protein n=1 Tax=Allobaculum mucilyticum TaxID=2834459 RepID=UPI003B845891
MAQPEDPVREGYTFEGWFTEESCTNEFSFDQAKPEESLTLYAKWTKDEEPIDELNWTLLDRAIAKGRSINKKLASYQDKGKTEFSEAFERAEILRTAEDVSQSEIDGMARELASAELALRLTPSKDLLTEQKIIGSWSYRFTIEMT